MPDMTKRLRDQGGGLFIEGPFVVESGRDFFRAFHLVDERVRDRRRFLVDNAVAGGEPQRVVVSLFQRRKAARQPGMATRDFQENAVRGGVGRHESGVVAGLAQIGLAIVDATGIAAPSVAPVVFKVTAARIERREAFAAQFERGGVVLVQPTLEVVISVEADPSYPWIVQKALCRLHGLSRQGLHSDAAG